MIEEEKSQIINKLIDSKELFNQLIFFIQVATKSKISKDVL